MTASAGGRTNTVDGPSSFVFGRFAIKGNLPERGPGTDLLICVPGRLEIFRSGPNRFVHCHTSEDCFNLAFGRPLSTTETPSPTTSDRIEGGADKGVGADDFAGVFVRATGLRSGDVSLQLAADKYGLRPLFFAKAGDVLLFATHMKGIVRQLHGSWPAVAEDDLLHYYHFGFTRNDRTLFSGIHKVPPGCALEVACGSIETRRYFSILSLWRPAAFSGFSEARLAETIAQLLTKSVRKRIPRGDILAVALSGGVDSGLITAALASIGAPFRAYTLIYKDRYSESDRIAMLARKLNFEVRPLEIEAQQVLDALIVANQICSEPAPFNSAIMRIVAAVAARDGATTLFDGDGADRLFLGMNRYRQYARLLAAFRLLHAFGLTSVAAKFLEIAKSDEANKAAKLFRTWREGLRPYPERMLESAGHFDLAEERKIYDISIRRYDEEFRERVGTDDFGLFFTYVSSQMCPEMFFQAAAEMQEPLGLSPAPAFWDDELISLALSVPTSLKLRGRHTKFILRKAAAAQIDPDYAFLPKIGLQSAKNFLLNSEVGRRWHSQVVTEIRDSDLYNLMCEAAPGRKVEIDRLIPLHVWIKTWRQMAAGPSDAETAVAIGAIC